MTMRLKLGRIVCFSGILGFLIITAEAEENTNPCYSEWKWVVVEIPTIKPENLSVDSKWAFGSAKDDTDILIIPTDENTHDVDVSATLKYKIEKGKKQQIDKKGCDPNANNKPKQDYIGTIDTVKWEISEASPEPTPKKGDGETADFNITEETTKGKLEYKAKLKGSNPEWPSETDPDQPDSPEIPKEIPVVTLKFITPAGDPVKSPVDGGDGSGSVADGANEFTYSTAASGVLTIPFKVKIPGVSNLSKERQDKFKFDVDAMGNSNLKWDVSSPDGKPSINGDMLEAKVTFTGLPEHNSDFGNKVVRIKYDDKDVAEENFETFFPKVSTNHPLKNGATSQDPNWFYYWKEGNVCGIPSDAKYDSTADYGYVKPGVDRILRLGPLAPETNNGPETFTSPTTYGSLTVTGSGKGIKCVAETAEHELHHLAIYDDKKGKTDGDHDGVADSSESGLDGVNSDPNDGDTYRMQSTYGSVYVNYGDNEIRCRKKELSLSIQYYPKLDWANPGCQNKNQFGPTP
jgi:hypothetical protein